ARALVLTGSASRRVRSTSTAGCSRDSNKADRGAGLQPLGDGRHGVGRQRVAVVGHDDLTGARPREATDEHRWARAVVVAQVPRPEHGRHPALGEDAVIAEVLVAIGGAGKPRSAAGRGANGVLAPVDLLLDASRRLDGQPAMAVRVVADDVPLAR